MTPPKGYDVKSIAVIGAGPAGLAAAKYLLAEQAFAEIDIFEQRKDVGGVWNFTPETGPALPSLTEIETLQNASRTSEASDSRPIFVSAMYDDLETNIPRSLMQYSDLDFPSDAQLFPHREIVMQYLERYAEDVRYLIKFRRQVLDVRILSDRSQPQWKVTIRDLSSGQIEERIYDAVVVASGHYDMQSVPQIPGMTAWAAQYPGSIIHSKAYRSPRRFQGQSVIVVGNSASGVDIGNQISLVCKHPLLVSQRSPSFMATGAVDASKEDRPEIAEFIVKDRTVRFVDGTSARDVDAVVFCTGYSYSYPFLSTLEPRLIHDGSRTEHVYQHIFHIPHPTLTFLALPQRIVPFIISESQSAVIARVWANRIQLPTADEMMAWERRIIEEVGPGKLFHTMGFPRDVDYINDLYDWSMRAKPPGLGKPPPYWGEKERWVRERCHLMRAVFGEQGEHRHRIRTVEDLGFDPVQGLLEQAENRSLL